MPAQGSSKTAQTMSVPVDMLALTKAEQPVYLTIPSTARTTVTGHTNAVYYQQVRMNDITGGRQYTFSGSGEGETPMEVDGSNKDGKVILDPLRGKDIYRTLSLRFEYSASGKNGSLQKSDVLLPRMTCKCNNSFQPQSLEWEISSEDKADCDYNDSVIRVVAEIGQAQQ